LGKLKQVRAYSQLEGAFCSLPDIPGIVPDRNRKTLARRMTERAWGRPFDDPIEVDGRKLTTLRDAGEYIAALPKKEHDAPEWRA
jgi:hypothetical protein